MGFVPVRSVIPYVTMVTPKEHVKSDILKLPAIDPVINEIEISLLKRLREWTRRPKYYDILFNKIMLLAPKTIANIYLSYIVIEKDK